MHKEIRIGPISTSEKEITDLIKAWAILSIAFAIVLNGLSLSFAFVYAIVLAASTVGVGFIFHEMAHKVVAQHYGCFAEFRADYKMLFFALIMSFFGFVFAAPGAVMISGPIGRRRNGAISAAGAITNLCLALIFLILFILIDFILIRNIAYYGFFINSWLALFNMLPLGNFDGKKIWRWNRIVYISMVIIAVIFMIGTIVM